MSQTLRNTLCLRTSLISGNPLTEIYILLFKAFGGVVILGFPLTSLLGCLYCFWILCHLPGLPPDFFILFFYFYFFATCIILVYSFSLLHVSSSTFLGKLWVHFLNYEMKKLSFFFLSHIWLIF